MPNPYLTALVPKDSLAAWYPLDNDLLPSDGYPGNIVIDESGNGRDLETPPSVGWPVLTANVLNGHPGIVFSEATAIPFLSAGILTPLTNIFAVVKVDGEDFGANDQGLITALDDAAGIDAFVGSAGGTKWGNAGVFAGYYKSDVGYATSDMRAPFTNFERIEGIYAPGTEFQDGFQLGQVREATTKKFLGSLVDLAIYTSYLTDDERRRLRLYADLKYGLHLLNGTTLNFPTPAILGLHGYSYFNAEPKDWGEVTDVQKYYDGGRSFNECSDTPPREWEVAIDCLGYTHTESKEKTDIYDAFYDAVRFSKTFNFIDKYGTTHTGVRIKEGGYSRAHDENKSWTQEVRFRLVKYPA